MRKRFIIIFAVTAIFLVVVSLLLRSLLYRSLPDYNGELAVEEIKSTVEIYRDSLAIPYIFADTEEDGAFAVGYLHAQERMFQMDLTRRAGEGRLSEVLGTKTLPFDAMFLTAGLTRAAKAMWERAAPETKRMLTAYAKGVNQFIAANKNHLSFEFDLLRYEPAEWKPYQSLIVARLMAWELNMTWWTDFAFTRIKQKLGEEKMRLFLPEYTPGNLSASTIPEQTPIDVSFMEADRDFRGFLGMNGTHIGSNNWAVSGAHSVSGNPVIANDPHLAFSAPGKWYIVNIRAGKWNASGVTLPGIPEMVIGKNENIAWALTNVMADQTDFYIETVNKEKTHYKVDTAWKPLKKMEYTIKVKDSSDVRLEVWETHHGPVISGVHLFSNLKKVENNAPYISMRWTGNDVSDEYYAMYQINRARDWSAFRQGVKYFTTPGQNFLYADVQGNIGFICGSKIPLRGAGNPNFAMDGADTRNDWTGYVPYETMPYVFNPPEGKLATANNNVTPSFPHYITGVWEPTSRIDRINEMLSLQDTYSPADFKRMQMDFFSPYAREITAHLLAAFKDVKITDPNLKWAVKLLSEWDGDFLPELPAPAIYAAFFKHLLLNTFRDELGGELFNQYCMIANVPYRAIQRMLTDNAYPLIDDVTTANKKETRDDIIRKSMGNALTELETAMGKDIHAWRWGKIHHVTFKHFFHGTSSVLDNFIDIGPAEIGGDGTTVFNTEYPLNEYHSEVNRLQTTPYENILGPSMRFICDLSTPDQFEIVLPTGQSGNILSPHYSDMTERWLRGGYYTLRVSAEAGRKNRDKLTLRPGG